MPDTPPPHPQNADASPRPSRRAVLGAGVGLLAGAGLAGRAAASAPSGATGGRARNVIFLVVDGMSIGTFTIADMVMQRRGGGTPDAGSRWARLWGEPGVRRSMMSTRAADSLVTDSAAGGSAWGCGRRLKNGSICFDEREGEIEPVLVSAKRAGKSTGLVSTARITHATPASFVATVPTRNMERIIAEQELERGVDVLLGGGAKNFSDELLAQHADLTVVRDAAGMRAAAGAPGRLLGLFTDDHMSYELDREDDEPHLREMSMLAIERLSRNEKGFVLQIEAGRVDHGGHANDFPAMLHDQIAFEETVGAVLDWAHDRDDTLIIITTDHGNSGPELTLYGEDASRGMETLLGTTHTLSWMLAKLRGRPRDEWPAGLRDLVREHAGVQLTDEQVDWALKPTRGERVDPFRGANTLVSAVGKVMADHYGIAFVSKNHTAEHVEATAFGPGSDALPHRIENYELHALMMNAMALA
jgi:alkaline phosphatase